MWALCGHWIGYCDPSVRGPSYVCMPITSAALRQTTPAAGRRHWPCGQGRCSRSERRRPSASASACEARARRCLVTYSPHASASPTRSRGGPCRPVCALGLDYRSSMTRAPSPSKLPAGKASTINASCNGAVYALMHAGLRPKGTRNHPKSRAIASVSGVCVCLLDWGATRARMCHDRAAEARTRAHEYSRVPIPLAER